MMLGSGGTGKVYVVRKDDGRDVVRKQAFRDVPGAQGELDNQERTYRRLRDARGSVSHISEFIGAGRIPDGNKFIQVQHLPNATDLYKILRSDAPTIMNNWLETAESIINAVMWMHDNRTAHGDIKPANILIVPSEGGKPEVRLIDFGYSTTPEDGPVKVLGTALYMPPELLQKPEDDKMMTFDEKCRYDDWALGLVLAQMLQKFGSQNDKLDEFLRLVLKTCNPITTANDLLTNQQNQSLLRDVNNLLMETFPSYDMNLLDIDPSQRRLKHKCSICQEGISPDQLFSFHEHKGTYHKCCLAYWAVGTPNKCPICRAADHIFGPISQIVAGLQQQDALQELLPIAIAVDCLLYLVACLRDAILQGDEDKMFKELDRKLEGRWKGKRDGTLADVVFALTYLPHAGTFPDIVRTLEHIITLVGRIDYEPVLMKQAIFMVAFLATSSVEKEIPSDDQMRRLAKLLGVSNLLQNKEILRRIAADLLTHHIVLFPTPRLLQETQKDTHDAAAHDHAPLIISFISLLMI